VDGLGSCAADVAAARCGTLAVVEESGDVLLASVGGGVEPAELGTVAGEAGDGGVVTALGLEVFALRVAGPSVGLW